MTLHFTSAHPKHCREGIPYGQFLRLRRICTKDTDFVRQALFLDRGYPRELILREFIRATCKHRGDLLIDTPPIQTPDQPSQHLW